jgi:hypothetical protein
MDTKIIILAIVIVCLWQCSSPAVMRSPYPVKAEAPSDHSGAGHEISKFAAQKKV